MKAQAKAKAPVATQEEMIDAVKTHALNNYEKGGWDIVVECWDSEDILRWIEGAKTCIGAIRKVSSVVGANHRYATEIRSTAF